MNFDIRNFDKLLPTYLSEIDKERLRKGLGQFKNEDKGFEKNYDDFFLAKPPNHIMQGDIFHSVKLVQWSEEEQDYYSGYTPAILLSNSCDVSVDNKRLINLKQSILAPVIPLGEYIKDLEEASYSMAQIKSFINTVKNQEYSNIFYIPKNEHNDKEFIVFFDKIVFHPTSFLLQSNNNLSESRFISLSNFGFYLLLVKLSFHFCRLPEQLDGREIKTDSKKFNTSIEVRIRKIFNYLSNWFSIKNK